ncbi:Heterokaryon incompatibility protein [Madurella fahalii]|uniref:Heterokaryon incompatibility protein n=1 Tax=Madurella fahalii TaxID=1157608 RepID=A0ABQ0GIV5_9PEZI
MWQMRYQLCDSTRLLDWEDPRRPIYTLLDALGAGLVPGNNDLVSTARLYADFARGMIQRTGELDILNCVREWRGVAIVDKCTCSDCALLTKQANWPRITSTSAAGQSDATSNTMDGLPSWAPNLACTTVKDPEPLLDWCQNPRYGAAKLMEAQPRDCADPNTLTLSGIRFDEVSVLGVPWHPDSSTPPSTRRGITALEHWEDLALATPVLSCPYGGAEGRREALWRTYLADYAADGAAPKHARALVERWYGGVSPTSISPSLAEPANLGNSRMVEVHRRAKESRALAVLIGSVAAESEPKTRNPLRIIRDMFLLKSARYRRATVQTYEAYTCQIYNACAHRRLLVTKRGYIGLAPWNAVIGDVVAVLHGGRTPFLLRPRPVPGTYLLVGECFVYGIMSGEALAWEHAIAAAREFRIV